MKTNKIILLWISVLAVSLIANVFFLAKDIFNGTYYQISNKDNEYRYVFSVDGRIVDYKRYNRNDGSIEQQATGYYEINHHDGQKIINVMDFVDFGQDGSFNGLLSLHRKSVFVMSNYSGTIWWVCPSAIVIQILWFSAEFVLIWLLLKKIKTPCRNQRQG